MAARLFQPRWIHLLRTSAAPLLRRPGCGGGFSSPQALVGARSFLFGPHIYRDGRWFGLGEGPVQGPLHHVVLAISLLSTFGMYHHSRDLWERKAASKLELIDTLKKKREKKRKKEVELDQEVGEGQKLKTCDEIAAELGAAIDRIRRRREERKLRRAGLNA